MCVTINSIVVSVSKIEKREASFNGFVYLYNFKITMIFFIVCVCAHTHVCMSALRSQRTICSISALSFHAAPRMERKTSGTTANAFPYWPLHIYKAWLYRHQLGSHLCLCIQQVCEHQSDRGKQPLGFLCSRNCLGSPREPWKIHWEQMTDVSREESLFALEIIVYFSPQCTS